MIKNLYAKACRALFAYRRRGASEIVKINHREAARKLQERIPWPEGKVDHENVILEKYDLMIVVPAYNSEKWIEKCVKSIINQKTRYTFEIVVINDGSTDNTGLLLEHYEKGNIIRLINQTNKGFSGARNSGISLITGRYVMFVDSDDQLVPDAVERLLNYAYKTDADIVEGGFKEVEKNGRVLREVVDNEELSHGLSLRGYPWGKIFKSGLFKNTVFPEGYWFEDSIVMWRIQYKVANAIKIPFVVYERLIHKQSITAVAQNDIKALHTYYLTCYLWSQMAKNEILFSNLFINQVHNQLSINYIRTKYQDDELLKCAFVLIRQSYINLIPSIDWFSFDDNNRVFDEAIRNYDYGLYKLMCNNWRWLQRGHL